MALGKDKEARTINANIPDPVMTEFEVARARRKMNKQDALAEAMSHWAAGVQKAWEAERRENATASVPEPKAVPEITKGADTPPKGPVKADNLAPHERPSSGVSRPRVEDEVGPAVARANAFIRDAEKLARELGANRKAGKKDPAGHQGKGNKAGGGSGA